MTGFGYHAFMRVTRLILIAVCVLASSAPFAKPKRSKIECSDASMTKLKPGWGHVPPALQKVPPGASLCGVNAADVAFVVSELDAKALETFYAPLFAAVGCKPLTCKPGQFTPMECLCSKADRRGKVDPRAGYVLPQPYDQAYQLFFAEP